MQPHPPIGSRPTFVVPNVSAKTALGNRSKGAAARGNGLDDDTRGHADHMQHVVEILGEQWAAVVRAALHVQRYRTEHDHRAAAAAAAAADGETLPRFVPMEPLCVQIMHNVGLVQRDEPALGAVIASCVVASTGATTATPATPAAGPTVDMHKLRALCRASRTPVNWVRRFQADGCIDSRVQRATTGVIKNCNEHRKLYSGPPFAVGGDSACTEVMQRRFFEGKIGALRGELKKAGNYGFRVGKEVHAYHKHESKEQRVARVGSSAAEQLPRWWISNDAFRTVLARVDRLASGEEDIKRLVAVMDPRGTQWIDIDAFVARFGWELMKSRCNRNTVGPENNDGVTNAFEWRAALPGANEYDRRAVMESLNRARQQPTLAAAVRRTRAFALRKQIGHGVRGLNALRDHLTDELLATLPEHVPRRTAPPVAAPWNQGPAADPRVTFEKRAKALRAEFATVGQRVKADSARARKITSTSRMQQLRARPNSADPAGATALGNIWSSHSGADGGSVTARHVAAVPADFIPGSPRVIAPRRPLTARPNRPQ